MAIILRPRHFSALWGAMPLEHEQRTPERLRYFQRAHLARNPAAHEPTEFSEEKPAYIGNGAWRIHCRCGERTHADPEWKLACCFGCGAIWTNVVFPENWQAIEDLLSKRVLQGTRNWQPPETYDDLVAEQVQHGEAIS